VKNCCQTDNWLFEGEAKESHLFSKNPLTTLKLVLYFSFSLRLHCP